MVTVKKKQTNMNFRSVMGGKLCLQHETQTCYKPVQQCTHWMFSLDI